MPYIYIKNTQKYLFIYIQMCYCSVGSLRIVIKLANSVKVKMFGADDLLIVFGMRDQYSSQIMGWKTLL